jgi:hypothetical protein
MTVFKKDLKKTLLYNLIIFDFILLESSTKKISNFFIEKFETATQKNVKKNYRLSLESTTTAFKRYIRFLNFLKKKKKNLLTFISHADQNLELLNLVFKNFKLDCFINFSSSCNIAESKLYLKSLFLLDFPTTKSNFLFFFFKKIFLIQSINDFEDSIHYNTYKIFSSLEDYKKIIFLSLIIVSIFKK